MKSRYKDGFSSSDRKFLEALHKEIFHKVITITGCADCYRDAYIILFNKLKKDGKMPEQANFVLRAGVLLHTFGSSEYYVHEVPDEVALAHLKSNPDAIKKFIHYPNNWKELIEPNPAKDNIEEKAEETPAETKKETSTRKPRKSRGRRKAA